ncbi:MAG: hypothetical protein H7124_07805 [Phycisphaerales bacterium]|nr:hypothetical protein [Hyphomonadaceae bacterium]
MHGIPRHLRRAHEATFYFHDRIVEAMKEIDSFGPRTFAFTANASLPASDLMGMDAITLARVCGQGEKARQLLLGECVLALTADALHYICESLFSYEKGKLSVSLSLMRKPLKENLLMLEWILADDADFFDAFSSPDRKRLNIDTISPERRKEIITRAIKKIDGPAFEDADVLYDVRYNKGANGLEPLWQKAQHLTTTKHANVLTEIENFNFIFATPENVRGIYESISPLYLSLAIHFYDVAGRALQRTYPRHRGAHDFDQMCKAAALALATKNYGGLRRAFGEAMQVCKEELRCTCGATPEITPTTFARALFSGDFYCSGCGESGTIDLFEAMGLAKQAS